MQSFNTTPLNAASLYSASLDREQRDAPSGQLYRIWIAGFENWRPTAWSDVPPRAIALEPAEADALSDAQARAFLEGFNGHMLREAKRLWAVAVPVVVGYQGDARASESVTGQQF
jgi:hypothetical protein